MKFFEEMVRECGSPSGLKCMCVINNIEMISSFQTEEDSSDNVEKSTEY